MIVTCVGRFWGRDPQSLRNDTHVVAEARSVPKKLFVAELHRVVRARLAIPLNAEAIDHLHILTTSILNVLLDHFVLFTSG
jgi:hypothetical protein